MLFPSLTSMMNVLQIDSKNPIILWNVLQKMSIVKRLLKGTELPYCIVPEDPRF